MLAAFSSLAIGMVIEIGGSGPHHSGMVQMGSTMMPPEFETMAAGMMKMLSSDMGQMVADMGNLAAEVDIEMPGGGQLEVVSNTNIPPELRAQLVHMLPLEISSLFDDIAPEPEVSSHPCGAEIDQCNSMGASGRSEIETCLVTNYEYLTPTCKCFLHKILPPETAKKLSPVAPAPSVTAVDEMPPPPQPVAHVSCVLLMSLFLFFTVLLVRRCCARCCASKPQFEAVVLPEVSTIKTVEPLVAAPVVKVSVQA